MKNIRIALLPFLFYITLRGQTNSGYTGDITQCPHYQQLQKNKEDNKNAIIIEDFESKEAFYKKWSNPMESGTMRSSIDICDTAREGKGGAKISFIGSMSEGSWTNLQCKASIPSDKTKITFWAKSDKDCNVKLTLYQGVYHNEMEIFGKTILLTTKWKKYEVPIGDIKEVVFSHFKQDGKKPSEEIKKEKVNAIGFADSNAPAVFYLDNITLE